MKDGVAERNLENSTPFRMSAFGRKNDRVRRLMGDKKKEVKKNLRNF